MSWLTGESASASESLMNIPSSVISEWPYIFGFALIDYVGEMLLPMLPIGGSPTQYALIQSLGKGTIRVAEQVYWDGPYGNSPVKTKAAKKAAAAEAG